MAKKVDPILPRIGGPDDVRAIPEKDLPQLAQEIRDELIRAVSKTGGHLGPNLGVVELTMALHRAFQPGVAELVLVPDLDHNSPILSSAAFRAALQDQEPGRSHSR